MVAGKKEIEITIAPDGSVHIETMGVKGKSCLELTKFLEEALGGELKRELKPDYYEPDTYITDSVSKRY